MENKRDYKINRMKSVNHACTQTREINTLVQAILGPIQNVLPGCGFDFKKWSY